VLSGASGAEPATGEERNFFTEQIKAPIRATGTYLGHAMEPQFPMNIALAAMVVSRGKLFPPGDKSGVESPTDAAITQVAVTAVGHWRGEGLALVEAAA
jgi:3-oxoacyl-[acyl-carrier-protein] synthase II